MDPNDDLGFLSCQDIADYSFDYVAGTLPESEGRLFRGHLRNCPECMKFFETYRRTPDVSKEALALQMPERVKMAVRTFLRERYGRTDGEGIAPPSQRHP